MPESPNEKRFTQDEVNALIKKERLKYSARSEALERELAEHKTLKDELVKRSSELEAERDALAQKVATHRADKAATQLSAALTQAGALVGALPLASREFVAGAELERDDDDNFVAITYGGKRYDSIEVAAREFLKENPFFAKGTAGGTGAGRAFGHSTAPAQEQEPPQTVAELAKAGWAEAPR